MPKQNLDELTRTIAGKLYQRFEPALKLLYLKVALSAHALMASETPVDTGYLRFSLRGGLNGDVEDAIAPRAKDAKPGQYVDAYGEEEDHVRAKLAQFKLGDTITLAYLADYAIYVEDRNHMIQTTYNALPQLVRDGVNSLKAAL